MSKMPPSKEFSKPKFPRLKRLLLKRRQETRRWYTTADAEGNVQVHPAR